MTKLTFHDGRPVPGWMARMLSNGTLATPLPGDTFWADMRAKVLILQADLAQAEQDADQLILDLTRAQMAAGL